MQHSLLQRMEEPVTSNVGGIDRIARVIIGLLLIAYAIPIGFPSTGWNWVGWIGVVPILTAIFGYCPAYTIVGLSTRQTSASNR
jgi:DUF2892 family protein